MAMNPYSMLMGMPGQGPNEGMARPVHHILEEVDDPTKGPGGKQVVGSTLRQDMMNQMNQFRQIAADPSQPMHIRKRLHQLANQLEVDIGEEDLWHESQKEQLGPIEEEGAFARLQAERQRARAGEYRSPDMGMTPGAAKKKGWVPPR